VLSFGLWRRGNQYPKALSVLRRRGQGVRTRGKGRIITPCLSAGTHNQQFKQPHGHKHHRKMELQTLLDKKVKG